MLLLLCAAALRLDWKPIFSSMAAVRPAWLVGGLCISSFGVLLRGLRLALVSGSVSRCGQGWRAFSLGYVGFVILPLGSGELVKVAAFQQLSNLSFVNSAAAVLMDRILDMVGMLAILLIFLSLGVAPIFSKGPLIFIFFATVLLISAITALAWQGHRIRLWFANFEDHRGIAR